MHPKKEKAGVLCRFPMRLAVALVQTRTTTKRTKWRVTSTPKLVTTPAPIPNRETA